MTMTKSARLLFRPPSPGQYNIVIEPKKDVSLITVTKALGQTGVQALDQFYANMLGRDIAGDKGRGAFNSNMYGLGGSFVDAAIVFEGQNNETTFGFWAEELKGGPEEGLYPVAARICCFLETVSKADVTLDVMPSC